MPLLLLNALFPRIHLIVSFVLERRRRRKLNPQSAPAAYLIRKLIRYVLLYGFLLGS